MDIRSVIGPASASCQRRREHPGGCRSPSSFSLENQTARNISIPPSSSTSREAVEDPSPHPPCSIVTWGDTTEEDDGAHKQNPGDFNRRPLATTDDLRDEIARIAAPREVPAAAATTSSAFVTTASSEQQQPPHARRKPLIILHGLPEPFLSALLESPLDIDPAFIEAHARRRRYRPRGGAQARRRGGGASHWDYPELVSGCRQAMEQQRQQQQQQQQAAAARPVGGGTGGDVAAVSCRASLWGAEGADVLFLDDHDGSACRRSPGRSGTLRQAWERSGATSAGCASVGREGAGRGEAGGRWQVVPPERGEGMASPGGVLQEIIGAGDIDGGTLEDVLEEAAYDRWLEFFEVLTPRRRAIVPDRPSLEWRVMQALERNTDMGKDIARWRRRDNHNLGYYHPDWEGLMRRLQMRVEMLTTMPPRLKPPTARPSRNIPIHESNLGLLPMPRQPALTDTGGDPSSAANDNQHALDRVTYLGGILLPFSIVSGVLSMNEDFGPGHTLFWVFWVVAVPLAVLVLLVIYADKLRRVEEYVWDPVKSEDPDEGVKMTSFALTEAVVARREDGEVVIDLGTPSTTTGSQADPAWPHPRPSAGPPTPDDGQAHSEQQTDDEEEDYSADEDLDDIIYVAPPPMHSQPNTIPSPTVANPERIVDDIHHHRRRRRHQRLRKQQLGWAGAVQCMLHLRKPSLVSDGVPAGATGGPRKRLETR